MLVFQDKNGLQTYLSNKDKSCQVGLVPTMGALHVGHVSLVKRALSENDIVIVSIFVNPTQFNNPDDFEKYPKSIEKDMELLQSVSEDIVLFSPSVSEIYSDGVTASSYDFKGLDEVMEGAFRKNHFNGVGTIVEKLFRLIQPQKAYFGEKDFQQLLIIKKMVALRQLPTEVIGCPVVREPNGLAMSSRNQRLSASDRENASFIFKTLLAAKEKFGTESAENTKDWVYQEFNKEPQLTLEYFEIMDENTLRPCIKKQKNTKYRGFIAVYMDEVRLIDNIAL